MRYLVLLLLLSCARVPIKPYRGVDRDIMPYILQFEKDYSMKLEKVSARLYDLELLGSNAAGICRYHYRDTSLNEIFIDRDRWRGAPDLYRKMLVYHELGHCILHRDHRNTKLEDGCPSSLMNSRILNISCYYKHEEYYLRELKEKEGELLQY